MRAFILLLATSCLCLSSLAMASDQFASDSKGMVEALTAEPEDKGIRMRSANLRGLQRIQTDTGDARIMDLPAVASSVNLKIEFDINSYTIRPSSIQIINALGHALSDPALAGRTFIVGGHTDSDGEDNYNLDLSLKRSAAVKEYLVSHYNIPAERLKVVGYGETSPIDLNSTSSGKQKNRRVEVQKVVE